MASTDPVTTTFGVLFDWDGVVVDSSPLHQESWKILAHEVDLPLTPAQFTASFGRVNREIIPDIFGWTDDPERVEQLGRRKEEIYRELIVRKSLNPLPGIPKLLNALRSANVPCVVCTSTERKNIEVSLEVLGFTDFFVATIASDNVTRGKPDPEVFLKGAEVCGLPPTSCVVLEDSRHGLLAARNAGIPSIGVVGTHPAAELEDLATIVAPNLEVVSIATFHRLLEFATRKDDHPGLPRPPSKPH